MRFANFLSGGFTTMEVINPLERKLAKRTYVQCVKEKPVLEIVNKLSYCVKLQLRREISSLHNVGPKTSNPFFGLDSMS